MLDSDSQLQGTSQAQQDEDLTQKNQPKQSNSRFGKIMLFWALGMSIFILDQVSKHPFRSSWAIGQTQPINPFLSFTYVQNTGSLAGMFQGNPVPLGIISLLVSGVIIWYAYRLPANSRWFSYLTLGVLLGGATGNMWDRLVHHFVVDFFDLRWQGRNIWPIFNVADIAVDIAIVLFILMAFIDPDSELVNPNLDKKQDI